MKFQIATLLLFFTFQFKSYSQEVNDTLKPEKQFKNSIDVNIAPVLSRISIVSGNKPSTGFFYTMDNCFSVQFRRNFRHLNFTARGTILQKHDPFSNQEITKTTDSTIITRYLHDQLIINQLNFGFQKNLGKRKLNYIIGGELTIAKQNKSSSYYDGVALITKDSNNTITSTTYLPVFGNNQYGAYQGDQYISYLNIGFTLDLGFEYYFSNRVSASFLFTPSYLLHYKTSEYIDDPAYRWSKTPPNNYSGYYHGFMNVFVSYRFNGVIHKKKSKA